jgi:hypothetical protein
MFLVSILARAAALGGFCAAILFCLFGEPGPAALGLLTLLAGCLVEARITAIRDHRAWCDTHLPAP